MYARAVTLTIVKGIDSFVAHNMSIEFVISYGLDFLSALLFILGYFDGGSLWPFVIRSFACFVCFGDSAMYLIYLILCSSLSYFARRFFFSLVFPSLRRSFGTIFNVLWLRSHRLLRFFIPTSSYSYAIDLRELAVELFDGMKFMVK